MDVDRITNPLRLARGSHQPGSGKGCAMNVISYIEGDEEITDFPATTARPLASFVQLCNDLLAEPADHHGRALSGGRERGDGRDDEPSHVQLPTRMVPVAR